MLALNNEDTVLNIVIGSFSPKFVIKERYNKIISSLLYPGYADDYDIETNLNAIGAYI